MKRFLIFIFEISYEYLQKTEIITNKLLCKVLMKLLLQKKVLF